MAASHLHQRRDFFGESSGRRFLEHASADFDGQRFGAAPVLAVNSFGDAIAGWQTANGVILVAERRSGNWGAPITIAPAAFRQGSPHVALDDRDDEAIAWSGRGTTLVATRDAGGSWSAPTTVSKQSAGATARVALDGFGNAVAVFELVQFPVQATSILCRQFPARRRLLEYAGHDLWGRL